LRTTASNNSGKGKGPQKKERKRRKKNNENKKGGANDTFPYSRGCFSGLTMNEKRAKKRGLRGNKADNKKKRTYLFPPIAPDPNGG